MLEWSFTNSRLYFLHLIYLCVECIRLKVWRRWWRLPLRASTIRLTVDMRSTATIAGRRGIAQSSYDTSGVHFHTRLVHTLCQPMLLFNCVKKGWCSTCDAIAMTPRCSGTHGNLLNYGSLPLLIPLEGMSFTNPHWTLCADTTGPAGFRVDGLFRPCCKSTATWCFFWGKTKLNSGIGAHARS